MPLARLLLFTAAISHNCRATVKFVASTSPCSDYFHQHIRDIRDKAKNQSLKPLCSCLNGKGHCIYVHVLVYFDFPLGVYRHNHYSDYFATTVRCVFLCFPFHRQTCTRVDSDRVIEKLFLTLPRQEIEPTVFGLEV